MAVNVSLEELLEVGAHFGHQSRRWNPKMAEYIFAEREGVHVFDLAKTRDNLVKALEVLSSYGTEGKTILFVGTKKQVKEKVAQLAQNTGHLYVNERWLGGTLTNFEQIMRSIRKMIEMKDKLAKGEYSHFTKKERLLIERELADLQRSFGGLTNMKSLPDLIVIVDIHKEASAVREANQLRIPTIGIVDTNSDPTQVTYSIPMNDDASRALEFVMDLFEKALKEPAPKAPKAEKVEKKEKKTAKVSKKEVKSTKEK